MSRIETQAGVGVRGQPQEGQDPLLQGTQRGDLAGRSRTAGLQHQGRPPEGAQQRLTRRLGRRPSRPPPIPPREAAPPPVPPPWPAPSPPPPAPPAAGGAQPPLLHHFLDRDLDPLPHRPSLQDRPHRRRHSLPMERVRLPRPRLVQRPQRRFGGRHPPPPREPLALRPGRRAPPSATLRPFRDTP